jgi:hypothetical protein
MSTGTHLEMHRQHQKWLQDATLWVEEIELWMNESKKAIRLSPLTYELSRNAEAIAVHHAETCAHTRAIRTHEHALAQFEERGDDRELLVFAKKHRAEAAHHEQQRQTHVNIKQRHHALMAQCMRLQKEVQPAQLEAVPAPCAPRQAPAQ